MVGALDFLPASELMPTSANEPIVPSVTVKTTCQIEMPNTRKNAPYEIAKKETLAAHQGQKRLLGFPCRSSSEIKLMPFSSNDTLTPEQICWLVCFPSLGDVRCNETNSLCRAGRTTLAYLIAV